MRAITPLWSTYLISIMIITKLLWIILFLTHKYLVSTSNVHAQNIFFIQELLYIVWSVLMGLLLIGLFNHFTPPQVCLSGHVKRYLYILGILITVGGIIKAFKHGVHGTPTICEST